MPFFAWYLHWKLPEPRLSWLKEAHQWRPLVRAYLASTTFMDSQLGRVLDALDASGEASNTVIVAWSDNGWHLGEKDITGKNSLWERSTHVPLIFAGRVWPAARAAPALPNCSTSTPRSSSSAACRASGDWKGHSLVPQLKNANAKRPWPAITTHNVNNHTVRTEQWRYIRYADGSEELYNERKDPNEWTNVVADPENKKVVRSLAKWMPKVNLPPAPGSAYRVLDQTNGVWYWEGKPIKPEELEK